MAIFNFALRRLYSCPLFPSPSISRVPHPNFSINYMCVSVSEQGIHWPGPGPAWPVLPGGQRSDHAALDRPAGQLEQAHLPEPGRHGPAQQVHGPPLLPGAAERPLARGHAGAEVHQHQGKIHICSWPVSSCFVLYHLVYNIPKTKTTSSWPMPAARCC